MTLQLWTPCGEVTQVVTFGEARTTAAQSELVALPPQVAALRQSRGGSGSGGGGRFCPAAPAAGRKHIGNPDRRIWAPI